jgi:hypothetical protein
MKEALMFKRWGRTLKAPSPAMLVAIAALIAALGGTAYAATAGIVSIADPNDPSRVAKVNSSDQLAVSASGTVNTQLAAPANVYHSHVIDPQGCVTVATPPIGRALIVTQVRIDTYSDPFPGIGQNVVLDTGPRCQHGLNADVNPPGVGLTVLPFTPGLGIPDGGELDAQEFGSLHVEIYVDGFTVQPGNVPRSLTPAAVVASQAAQDG